MLGYALAVGVAVALVASLLLAKAGSDAVLTSTGTHFVAFIPSTGTNGACPPSDVTSVNSGGGLTAPFPLSVIGRIGKLPTVKHAAPFLLFRFRDTTTSNLFTVGGFDPADMAAVGSTSCAESDLIAGQFLKAGERGAVMLEEAYARQAEGRVGDTLLLASMPFRIVGIINPGVRPAKADVYMLLPDAVEAIGKSGCCDVRGQANMALVEVKSATVQDEAIKSVRGLLSGSIVSSYACYRPAAQVMGMNARSAWLLGLLVAVFAVAFAMKSQLSAVVERNAISGF